MVEFPKKMHSLFKEKSHFHKKRQNFFVLKLSHGGLAREFVVHACTYSSVSNRKGKQYKGVFISANF